MIFGKSRPKGCRSRHKHHDKVHCLLGSLDIARIILYREFIYVFAEAFDMLFQENFALVRIFCLHIVHKCSHRNFRINDNFFVRVQMHNHIRAQHCIIPFSTHNVTVGITECCLHIKMFPFLKTKWFQDFFKNAFSPIALNFAIVLKRTHKFISSILGFVIGINGLFQDFLEWRIRFGLCAGRVVHGLFHLGDGFLERAYKLFHGRMTGFRDLLFALFKHFFSGVFRFGN